MKNHLAADCSRSFSNFIVFNRNRQMPNDKTNEEYKMQSFNSIDLNPSYHEQINNSEDNELIEHLRSSNLLKRKSFLLASHLISNQLLTEEDYTTDFNKTDVGTIVFDKILLKNQKVLNNNKETTTISTTMKCKRLNKLNLFKNCSCSDLNESMLSHYPATNDFRFVQKHPHYLECLNLDKPKVIYSSLALLDTKKSNGNSNEYNKYGKL